MKIEELLARRGVVVPYRTLHRFAVERCGFRVGSTTVRVVDGEPGVECQVDFAQLGVLDDPETGRQRRVHALIFTAVVSRHMFVWLTFSQTLTAVIAGCEAAWAFFGGVVQGVDAGKCSAEHFRASVADCVMWPAAAGASDVLEVRPRSGHITIRVMTAS